MNSLAIFLRTALVLLATTAAMAQTNLAPTSTSLTSNSPTLTLPGSLTFTAVVKSTPTAQGVPTGNVTFTLDGGSSLGVAPLKIIPSTQSFIQLTPFSTGTTSTSLVSGKLSNATHPDLVVGSPGPNGPEFLLFPGLGQGLFDTANPQTYPIGSLSITDTIDSLVVGSFSAPGSTDVIAHTYSPGVEGGNGYSYYALLSKQPGGSLAATLSVRDLPTYPPYDYETMVANDFDGDGLSDIAYLVIGDHFGVALNNASLPGILSSPTRWYIPPITLSGATSPISLCPSALATGKFTASGHVDLIVAATQCGGTSPAPGYILLFAGDGTGGFGASMQGPLGIEVVPAVVVPVGDDPVAIATADFNQDGKLDVVVADQSSSSVHILYGNGDGTFQSTIATFSTGSTPAAIALGDFNGDSFPDVAVSLGNGSVGVLLNNGTGGLAVPARTYAAPAGSSPLEIVADDFNTDGYPDIAFLSHVLLTAAVVSDSANILLTSASAQAVLATAPQTISAGPHTITATFPGDTNLALSTSAGVQETVSRTVPNIIWPAPTPIVYGTLLGTAQLNATTIAAGTFTYTPPAGTLLPPGSSTLTALFTPTDSFDYSTAMASQTITVTPPSLISVLPATANIGDPATNVTVIGQGFLPGAVVMLSGTSLTTVFVDSNHLTASIPATVLQNIGTFAITAVDPNGVAVTGSQSFSVVAPPVIVSATGPTTIGATQQSPITLSVNPYPVPITATLTLAFTPLPPITVVDPTVLFSNGTATFSVDIPAQDTAAIPPISFQSGSTAGTITITIRLTTGGVDITPSSLTPITITVPAAPPEISTVTLTRSGKSLLVAITGLSSTREVSQATFHFVPATGQNLSTTDLSVSLSSAFTTWYQNEASTAFGTQFLYSQPFTLDSDATAIGSVTVVLTNFQGASAPSNAQ